ncbi:hypothetical protein BLL40_01350 [Domibacillus mangrovi]|uniref:Type II secretion system protein n=2 Tax=Domibacillus mangrovi TaxID=1714354 RepID=A0A1Q5P7E3_9BACI|nr:hypothetical protein BLL40_01350 [Domibacillus mangrovi]
MEGDVFIFWKSEEGFTLAESLLALTALFVAATFILPLCMKIEAETSKRWERQEGMRKLYEEAESRLYGPASFTYEMDTPNYTGQIYWEMENGKNQACVSTADKTVCVSE